MSFFQTPSRANVVLYPEFSLSKHNEPVAMNKDKAADSASIDKYTAVKDELVKQILKKQELNNKLGDLEDEIYEKEYEYFQESVYGNIVKGFDNFLKSSGSSTKKRLNYSEEDHIFSLSSMNFVKQIQRKQGTGPSSSSIKDDFDDYEDSVDPANNGKHSLSTERDTLSPHSTPTRKRKIRSLDSDIGVKH